MQFQFKERAWVHNLLDPNAVYNYHFYIFFNVISYLSNALAADDENN